MADQRGDPLGVERPARQRGVAARIDALGEPQAHQQELVGLLVAAEQIIDRHAVAERLDPHQPGFRAFLGRGGAPRAVHHETPMRARTDAGIFAIAPVDQVVAALGARPRVVGHLVGRQAGTRAMIEGEVVEVASEIVVRQYEFPARMQGREGRVGLDG